MGLPHLTHKSDLKSCWRVRLARFESLVKVHDVFDMVLKSMLAGRLARESEEDIRHFFDQHATANHASLTLGLK